MTRVWISLLAIVAIAVALVGAPVAQPKEIVIGVLYPLSATRRKSASTASTL